MIIKMAEMTVNDAVDMLLKFNGNKVLKPDEHKQIAALLTQQQKMIEAAVGLLALDSRDSKEYWRGMLKKEVDV